MSFALELRLYEYWRRRGFTRADFAAARRENLRHRVGPDLLAFWLDAGHTHADLDAARFLNRGQRTREAGRLTRRAA